MKHISIALCLCGMILMNTSCDNYDDTYPQEYEKILSLQTTGEQAVDLYKTGEATNYSITVIKSGSQPTLTASAHIGAMDAVNFAGTATLETALLGIPEVVVYRTLWFQVRLRPYVLKVPWVSLVNLNLGREAVAEVIQSDLDTTRAERELRAIVAGGEKRGRMLADFAELRTVIGGPGASDRFAARMVAELRAPETK